MNNSEVYDLIIIGGGPGGLSAGIYAMRAALKTVLIEKGLPGGQLMMTEDVENYPGYVKVTGVDLAMKFSEHAQSYGLEVIAKEVISVEPGLEFHQVCFDDGSRLKAHAIVFGTGGTPRRMNIPGEIENYGKGVSYCGVCDGFFFRNKTVVVVGGGDTAAEEALYLAKLAKQVYLVHRRDTLRAGMILQKRVKADCKIQPLWDTVVTQIKTNEQGVSAVDLENIKTGEKRELLTDGVFIFIGFMPNNTLVPAGVKMNTEGYVMTNDRCETHIPGIYAIGDLREKYARQIVLSAADGCTAALAAAHYVETKKAGDNVCPLPQPA